MSNDPIIELENVTFTYSGENQQASGIKDINLYINSGELVVLCGKSGCGKTTVTRLINGLIPHYYEGELSGRVRVCGQNVSEQPLYDTARITGSVFQNPRSQFFNVDTTSEITFGCENLGMPENEIRCRLERVTDRFHLENLLDRNIFMLSGGEKQKIACAGVSVMEPEVMILDEPSSNLDVKSTMELKAILKLWKEEGKTIVVSEHRLYYLSELADRYIYLEDGKIRGDYTKEEFLDLGAERRLKMGLRCFSMDEESLSTEIRNFTLVASEKQQLEQKKISSATLELQDFTYAYKHQPLSLHIHNCEIPGEGIVAIIGNNGAGKSTFSRCFCGLIKKCGTVIEKNTEPDLENGSKIKGREQRYKPKDRLKKCYTVMQDVNHQLFTESVLEEVMISMDEEEEKEAEKILDKLDLLPLKERHPMSLSGGQKQRVAIASAIASGRKYLFFDEPTSGLDYCHMQETAGVLKDLLAAGITSYVVTHDFEMILSCCTAVIHLENGEIQETYPVDEVGIQKLKEYFIK